MVVVEGRGGWTKIGARLERFRDEVTSVVATTVQCIFCIVRVVLYNPRDVVGLLRGGDCAADFARWVF